jgi:tRNA pseudouridine13 synthase
MKIKAVPTDFVVREESGIPLGRHPSAYAVYRLAKTSWDTFDLIDLISRRLGVRRDDVSVGGMKDRHGTTAQLISVRGLRAGRGGRAGAAPRELRDRNFALSFEGWSDRPVTARHVQGNRFQIILRDLTPVEAARVARNALVVAADGVPNYYDEQRFGSARHGAGFMGREIFLGRRERALRLWFTPSKHDDRRTRTLKRCVLENWGRWERCADAAFGEYARILGYLAGHRQAWHKALALLDRRFIVFVLNAYQSFLFNEVLAGWLERESALRGFILRPLRYSQGTYRFYGPLPPGVAERLQSARLPVPGYDSTTDDPEAGPVLRAVLEKEGIRLPDLRVRQMSGISVAGVERGAVVVPADLEVSAPAQDELYPGRTRITLSFFLPRGSYATLVIKRLMLAD